jgi:hypothetical protein
MASQHIIAVDSDAGHAVTDRPVRDRRARQLPADRNRYRPLVVLHEEDARCLEHGRKVQRLMHVALAGCAVTDKRQRHRVLFQALGGHRRADGMQSMRADLDRNRGDALLGEFQPAVPLSPPNRADLRRRDPAQQERADLAVLREQPVRLAKACRRADLRGFLATARREERQFTLALQIDELAVEIAGDDHRLV